MIPRLPAQPDYFPPVTQALREPNGLLAFGGDLSVPRLKAAYERGIFPWFTPQDPILWWSPDPRAVFWPETLHVGMTMRKFLRKSCFRYSVNRDFAQVIAQCAALQRSNQGTWITPDMQAAYLELHQAGLAHSIEVWRGKQLVGGLYGVLSGSVFCGESMFHTETNASKCALLALRDHLLPAGLTLIDCQVPNSHLESLGAQTMNRNDFIGHLQHQIAHRIEVSYLVPQEIPAPSIVINDKTG
ncbi:MAG: leucyl/phenylalanyl-tRNA--protein transferase [Idiomarina sp.]|nr:leucyl/phenylalanyl-tRNA--protein transferase [Idiomarina sp.]